MGRYTGKTCRLIFMLVLTASFFVTELVSGYVGNSIALVSDSFTMLSDGLALCVGIVTGRLSHQRRRRPGASYGSGRAEVVGALCNAVFLAALYFTILMEALQRLARPEAVSNAMLILVVGTIGLAINVVGLLVFQDWACYCGRRSPPPPYLSSGDESPSRTVASSSIALEGMVEMSCSAAEPRPKAGATRLPPCSSFAASSRFLPFLSAAFFLLSLVSPSSAFSLVLPISLRLLRIFWVLIFILPFLFPIFLWKVLCCMCFFLLILIHSFLIILFSCSYL